MRTWSEGWERVAGRGRRQELGDGAVETEDEMLRRSPATAAARRTNFDLYHLFSHTVVVLIRCSASDPSSVFSSIFAYVYT